MYLADVDIRERLDEINFECRLEEYPFRPDLQIGPASVDIRLDTKFWQFKLSSQKWRLPILRSQYRPQDIVDLRHHDIQEAQPTLHWETLDLAVGETLILKPGQSLMARTYEKFSMPNDLAGKFAARVSYSRLGLMVHCGNDFINPGFCGRHPLQLVNLSGLPIRIAPLFPIAQISFVKLSQDSEQHYGPSDRYWHDDGGPSKWWRDDLVKELVNQYGQDNLPRAVSDQINQAIRNELFTDDQLRRLILFRESIAASRFTTGVDLLTDFARQEQRTQQRYSFIRKTIVTISSLLWATVIGSFFEQPYWWLHTLFLVLAIISTPFLIVAVFYKSSDRPFFPSDLAKYQRQLRAQKRARESGDY